MSEIRYRVDAERAREAFAAAPEVMRRYLDGGASEGADRIAVYARRGAPKFHSILTNSIRSERVSSAVYRGRGAQGVPIVWQVEAKANYGINVEEGVRGPLRRRPGVEHGLLEWIRAKFRPADDAELDRIAFAVAGAMQKKGIRAQPFMRPAAERAEAAVMGIMREAVARGIEEVFGRG